jgi:hypothetical protein
MSITFVLDATHKNVPKLPAGILAALYTTGSPDIKATRDDFINHPNAIHICQDQGSDTTADIIDMENGAATVAHAVDFINNARHSFWTVQRPGQRWPGIYLSRSRVTEQANALVKAKLTHVPLWIAQWGEPQTVAVAEIAHTSGPFPVIGLQIRNQGIDDFSVFSTEWITAVSKKGLPKATVPPGQWKNPSEWTWKNVKEIGIGLDGKQHEFDFNALTGLWDKRA